MYYYDKKEFNDERSFEVYILTKYLIKHYGKEKAIVLLKARKNSLDKIAKALGQKDIAFFCLYYLTSFFVKNSDNPLIYNLGQVHYDIFNELNNLYYGKQTNNEEFILPRGTGKSTVINKALGCWTHCYKLSIFTVVIGKTELDAQQFIEGTKQMLMSPKIVDNFGVLVDRKTNTVNKNELELTNNTKLMAISSTGSIRGKNYTNAEGNYRPTIILIDK